MHRTKSLLVSLSAVMLLGAAPAHADLIFTLNPSVGFGLSGSLQPDADTCLAPTCVLFSGSLADTDNSAGTIIVLGTPSVTWSPGNPSSGFLTLDNTYFEVVPGGLEGDADNNPFPQSYSGAIFGIDIAPNTPYGIYTGSFEIDAAGGLGDPDFIGFPLIQQFEVDVVPEPITSGLTAAGLFALEIVRRRRNRRASSL